MHHKMFYNSDEYIVFKKDELLNRVAITAAGTKCWCCLIPYLTTEAYMHWTLQK